MIETVLDSSLALAFLVLDEGSALAEKLVERALAGSVILLMPPNGLLELANGLLTASRRGRLTPERLREAVRLLEKLPIQRVEIATPLPDLVALAQAERLTAFDAGYLSLAIERRAALATSDGALAAAARRHGLLWEP